MSLILRRSLIFITLLAAGLLIYTLWFGMKAENEKVQQAYQSFSQLGQLKSTGKPKYLWDRSDTSKSLGDIEIIGYQVPLEFDSGPATIKINLIADGKSYYIQHFGIHSEVFAEQQTAN